MGGEGPGPRPMSRRILILSENLSVPFDNRVWQESRALAEAGYEVTVVCPRGATDDTEPEARIEGRSHPAVPAARVGGGRAGLRP